VFYIGQNKEKPEFAQTKEGEALASKSEIDTKEVLVSKIKRKRRNSEKRKGRAKGRTKERGGSGKIPAWKL